jgi:hypothetical protein
MFSSNLSRLYCDGNTINMLNFSNVNLTRLMCGPILNPINVDNQTNLQSLVFLNTDQGSINLTNNTNLNEVVFGSVNVNYLDLSNCTNLNNCTITNTSMLEYINLKCGKTWSGDITSNNYPIRINYCPNLQFVCSDNSNLDKINQVLSYIQGSNNPNVVVSSYCSFVPGGNFNTITGTMTFDADNNGCDSSDSVNPNIRINIDNGSTTGASFTSNQGKYVFYTQAGSFDVTPDIENPTWFSLSPTTATIPFADNNNNVATQDFCITGNGSHQDLEMVMAPLTPARPGFDAVYKLVYRNKGNTIMEPATAGIILTYNTAKLTYVSSSQPVTATGTSSINFNYPQLLPFASGSIEVTFHVNAPTDSPAVNIGDELQFMTMISPNNLDENVPDNMFNYTQTVVGSFDPNDITCMEGEVVSPTEIGKYLHYVINFENTGTADAENIVVKDIINQEQFDLNSLQVLNSSDPVTAKLTGNVAEFIFKNINLHSGGHGNILIKIKSKESLVQGDSVSKQAHIYFDYNAPISTEIENTVFQSLSNPSFPEDSSISFYPNPVHTIVNITASNTITSVQLFDLQGRILETKLVNEYNTVLDLTTQSAGVYFIKVTTDKGIKVEKLVKE